MVEFCTSNWPDRRCTTFSSELPHPRRPEASMRKILVIARREYQAAVQTRAFLISLVVLPILIGGSVLLQWLVKDQVDTSEKKFAVIDRTPHEQLAAVLVMASDAWNKSRVDD